MLDENLIVIRDILKNMWDKYLRVGLGILDEERRMIFKVFSYSKKGYWYKCKNGEIFMCLFFLWIVILNFLFIYVNVLVVFVLIYE